MNELQVFNFNENEVRTKLQNNEVWFCLKDVCSILEIQNHKDVVSRLKKDGVDNNDLIDRLGRKQNAIFINESNLYKVVFQSRKPQAEKFTDWVTSEVLPSIRKTGGYKLPSDPRELLQLTIEAHENTAKRVDNIEREVNDLKDNAFLSPSEYNLVSTRINERVRHIINVYHLNPNRQQRSELYKAINREIKVITGIRARCQLRQKDLDTVLDFVNDWEPSKATMIVVEQLSLKLEEGK